jgi:ubiquinone/menaquinone biosynthesis C-methylase UbiE
MADSLGAQAQAAAFDEAAVTYDADFAGTATGRWLRQAVWSRVAPFVKPGMSALDLGCGTGEDALWLARNGCQVTAADGSPAMLEQVNAKATRLNLESHVRTVVVDLNARAETAPTFDRSFDLVISNFGAINCVHDLALLGRKLAAWVKPGGVVAFIFMGRFCAWETAYYLARIDRRAMRRWRGRAQASVGSQTVNVRYWSTGEMLRALRPAFRLLGAHGVGTFLPPSYLFHWVDRRPAVFRALSRWEHRTSAAWPLSRMGDHTLLMFRRTGTAALEPDARW